MIAMYVHISDLSSRESVAMNSYHKPPSAALQILCHTHSKAISLPSQSITGRDRSIGSRQFLPKILKLNCSDAVISGKHHILDLAKNLSEIYCSLKLSHSVFLPFPNFYRWQSCITG
jgi:hypothetical protein